MHSKSLLGLLLAFSLLTSVDAAPISINWETSSPTTDTADPANFSSGFITFAGFTANELSSYSTLGIMHNHSASTNQTIDLDILLDGVWTNIFTRNLTPADGSVPSLDGLTTPLAFPTGVVTGIRMASDPFSNQTWHLSSNIGNRAEDIFTFNQVDPEPVPEPASIAIWSALGVAGLFGARRRRKSRV